MNKILFFPQLHQFTTFICELFESYTVCKKSTRSPQNNKIPLTLLGYIVSNKVGGCTEIPKWYFGTNSWCAAKLVVRTVSKKGGGGVPQVSSMCLSCPHKLHVSTFRDIKDISWTFYIVISYFGMACLFGPQLK